MGIQNAEKKWTMPIRNWNLTLLTRNGERSQLLNFLPLKLTYIFFIFIEIYPYEIDTFIFI